MSNRYRCTGVTGKAGPFFDASKRLFDILASLFGLIFLSPFLVFVAILVAVTSPGPPFFTADRVGLREKHFWMIKFRSMVQGSHSDYAEVRQASPGSRNGPYFKNPDDSRITKVGRILRMWSIDELPQLVNVLRGEMSLVGPRPAFREEVDEMGQDASKRHSIKPGMTGICQVNGRTSIPYEDYVQLELHYLENRSWRLDLCILASTLKAVVSKAGAH